LNLGEEGKEERREEKKEKRKRGARVTPFLSEYRHDVTERILRLL